MGEATPIDRPDRSTWSAFRYISYERCSESRSPETKPEERCSPVSDPRSRVLETRIDASVASRTLRRGQTERVPRESRFERRGSRSRRSGLELCTCCRLRSRSHRLSHRSARLHRVVTHRRGCQLPTSKVVALCAAGPTRRDNVIAGVPRPRFERGGSCLALESSVPDGRAD